MAADHKRDTRHSQSSAHGGTGQRPGVRGTQNAGPKRRSGGIKVSDVAARALRAGHPWVFREALWRPMTGDAGAMRFIVDERGRGIGWGLLEPDGAIALHVLSGDEDFQWGVPEMRRRLLVAKSYRDRYVGEEISGACRLVHGAADGFPGIAVDRLGDYLLVYRYARAATYIETLLPVLDEVFSPRGIYVQDRVRAVQADDVRPPASHVLGKPVAADFQVSEDGLKYLIDVTAPVSPGLFLDLREGRRLVERVARDKNVLNLFSFTGSLGMRAVRGGAKSVTNVDSAARSHARCRQNLAASGLDSESCEAVTGDVFKHLERFRSRKRSFDLVVVDPPPFSNVRGAVFSALRDWSQLMAAISGVVAPGGEIVAVCNAAGLSEHEFLSAAGGGAGAGGRKFLLIDERGLPPDFPVIPAFSEGKYLKVKHFHVI